MSAENSERLTHLATYFRRFRSKPLAGAHFVTKLRHFIELLGIDQSLVNMLTASFKNELLMNRFLGTRDFFGGARQGLGRYPQCAECCNGSKNCLSSIDSIGLCHILEVAHFSSGFFATLDSFSARMGAP